MAVGLSPSDKPHIGETVSYIPID